MGLNLRYHPRETVGGARPVTFLNYTPVTVLYGQADGGVWIDNRSHPEVLVDRLPASLILGLHLGPYL